MSDRDPLPDFADLLELAPEDAWTAFRAQLTLVNPGVVVCSRWELDYSFGDDFDVESPADMGRARVVAALNPQFWEILEDAHDVRCDRDEGEDDSCTEQKLLTSLTELGARPSPEETEAVSSIAWEIDGAGMSWAGSIELYPHPTDSQWIVVTSTYDRETWGDYLPIVLGLVRREFIGEGAALVIRETVGHYISRPNRISWGNLSPFDAVVIVSGLGRNEPSPLEGLDLTELHDWSDFCEGTHLRLTELELEIGEARRIKALESELAALFAESIARRRKLPEVPPLPKDRPIDALQGRDLEALKDWFDRSRAERLRQIEWKPQGIKYRTSTPILVLHFEGAVESVWVPFAGATNPPTVQDVLAKLPVTEHTPPQRAAGETDIGYADYLWARGFLDEASTVYKVAATSGDFRSETAAAGHFIAEQQFVEAAAVLTAIVERCQAQRAIAREELSSSLREGMFVASLATERDAQRALTVLHRLARDHDSARAAFTRWRVLVKEVGSGSDPFLAP